jgi:hypothetical protein
LGGFSVFPGQIYAQEPEYGSQNLRFPLIIPVPVVEVMTIPMAVFGMKRPKQDAGEKDNHPNYTAQINR